MNTSLSCIYIEHCEGGYEDNQVKFKLTRYHFNPSFFSAVETAKVNVTKIPKHRYSTRTVNDTGNAKCKSEIYIVCFIQYTTEVAINNMKIFKAGSEVKN